jgi:hypothetical protein
MSTFDKFVRSCAEDCVNGGEPLRSRDWWVSVNDEPGTVWRGEKAIVAARACADELDQGDFIYESTDGTGKWRFVSEDGSTFVVSPAPTWGPDVAG